MKPLDPRLLKYARSAKQYIIEIAVLGVFISGLVIAQAFLISGATSPVITGGASLQSILPKVGWLALVVALRGLVMYFRESRAHRAADQTIAQLREQVISKAVRLGPRWRAKEGSNTATLVTRGLNDLDPYFVRYLPQLILVMTVTPATLATILFLDFWSAVVAVITIPLIPIFMILIGRMTQSASERKLLAMERLGSQLLDLLSGLPTLRALGREMGPRKHLVRLSRQNTKTTMETLQVAFLSGGVLEFLATLSVALVAVEVGMRMVSGQLDLFTGLIIIMLAPEVYEPLRQVGAQFHASANGVAAANACFEILEQEEPITGTLTAPSPADCQIIIDGLSVAARGAWAPDSLTAVISPGTITALTGPSGAGKTTTAMVLLGLEKATAGGIKLKMPDGTHVAVSDLDLSSWWQHITWLPQSPTIIAGTVRSNITETASLEEIEVAALKTDFLQVVKGMPDQWETLIGSGGIGLSVGQRQRLALTKALVERPHLLVLDEPTAHLDAVSEEQIVKILQQIQQQGTTILVIAHRQAVIQAADQTIQVETRLATAAELEKFPELSAQVELDDLVSEPNGFLDPANVNSTEATL